MLKGSIPDCMIRVYITFGQAHVHRVNGKTFDKDSVAVIECKDYATGRQKAFDWFDGVFHQCLSQEEFDRKQPEFMTYFPRGLVGVNIEIPWAHRCPNPACRYMITVLEIEHNKGGKDFPCPRCGKATISRFEAVENQ